MRVALIMLAVVFCASSLWCQEVPKAEVFGGYSYLNVDTNGLSSRQSANGWEASVSGNFNKRFAVEGDVSGYYKTFPVFLGLVVPGGVSVHDYGFLGGPRINFRPVFFHALLGADRLTGSAVGVSASQNGFAGAFGGGVQWKVGPQWAVRASGDYVLTRHNIFGGPRVTQHNFRASAGVVFTFGARTPTGTPTKRAAGTAAQIAATSEAALLGVVGYPSDNGFTVTSVRAGSPAAQAGINAGDIISKIDGQEVHSSHDIESAIAANATGTVRVTYLIKGAWSTEREIKVR